MLLPRSLDTVTVWGWGYAWMHEVLANKAGNRWAGRQRYTIPSEDEDRYHGIEMLRQISNFKSSRAARVPELDVA